MTYRPSTLAPLLFCTLVGCGEPPLDEEGERLAHSSALLASALESTFAASSLVAEVGFDNADHAAIDATASTINRVFGTCVTAARSPDPAVGMRFHFSGRCGIPFTSFQFRGDLAVDALRDESGRTLHVGFDRLELPSVKLDGKLDLSTLPDRTFAYDIAHLAVDVGDRHTTFDGRGTATYSGDRTSVLFSGTGVLTLDEATFSFVADRIERRYIGGCYAQGGTLALSIAVSPLGKVFTSTLHFTDDREVHLDYKGRTRDYQLPDRSCRGF
ncbi:MAG: hypothetical protein EXR72_21770 [Myxococcales bacterium]|nr:hypothetical protein [Myxococcales bacterium]